MTSPVGESHSQFVNTLWTQPSSKTEGRTVTSLPCPFGHSGRTFQSIDQLYNHARAEHASEIEGLDESQAKIEVRDAALKSRRPELPLENTVGGNPAPDIATLSLKERRTSPPSGKKRRAESDIRARREKGPTNVENIIIADPDHSSDVPYTMQPSKSRSKPYEARLNISRQGVKSITAPQRSATGDLTDRSADFHRDHKPNSPSTQRQTTPTMGAELGHTLPSGLIVSQRNDPRYPGLLLQPDSRPISQEQLASEVKSIYAGLTMVETKCMHVDRAQAAAPIDPNQKLASDHWQALIALHRTLLHEHHDFFLASQHPSASPALRRLAAKYTMPARMWKHGIHSFLELLRRRLPDSLDYMLAFIYLAYQMMALLYETVPAFEDTWIECLGDLGRYRMAIEDEDIRDRETWANVARSWYTKAADRNPPVGRLYHHLAILARPNALHQLYYYARSLNAVEPFPSARESILTLFDPILGRAPSNMSTALPIDASFIKAHAYTFDKNTEGKHEIARDEYISQLDNHIGRVTAKWKEQGVYTAVTNIAAWFDYGYNLNALRQLFLLRVEQRKNSDYVVEKRDPSLPPDPDLQRPRISEKDFPARLATLQSDTAFARATCLTTDTFSIVLRRIGDKNVLPHVHVMLSFLSTFASIEYVAHLLDNSPWIDISAFLNTLVKTETQQSPGVDLNTCICQPVFPSDRNEQKEDALPLPEDYLIRGLIWAEEYLPAEWFGGDYDDEDRYLELASTSKRRADRVLRLGYQLSTHNRWMTYSKEKHTFESA